MLFLSRQSHWQEGKAIRGGVPICFPWFAAKADDTEAPAHGFARIRSWELYAVEQTGRGVAVTLVLENGSFTKHWWPSRFRLLHRVIFASQLPMELQLTNMSEATLPAEEAHHTTTMWEM